MKHNIPLAELARLPNIYLPQLSHDREKIAFYWDKTGRVELYVMDLTQREARQISHGEVPRTPQAPFVWRRDDQAVIFGKDDDGNEQHDSYQITLTDGGVRRLTHDPESQELALDVSPDNAWLLVATNRFGQLNLAKVNLAGTGEYIQLTHFAQPVWSGKFSPDGNWVACSTNETADMVNQDVYLIHHDSGQVRRLLHVTDGSMDVVADWHPDGRTLAITSDAAGDNRPGLLDVTSGEVHWLGVEGVDETAVAFSANGRYLACLRNHQAEIRPVIYDIETGVAHDLHLPAGVAVGSAFCKEDTGFITLYMTPTRRPELLLYNLENDTFDVLLEADYGSLDPAIFVTSTHIWYPSFDGRDIPALLHVPPTIGPDEKRPAIVIVHGGPTAQFFQMFDPYAQFLVDQGYVVLKPNIRGSTGYGVAFRDMNRYDLGGGDLEDVAYGAAYLKSLPFVDPNRLAVFGGSYGGYMAYMQVVKKPELWKAGAAAVGITHWRTLYDDSMDHFKWYLQRLMGDFAENKELLEDRSALNFAQNLKARLLMIHGLNDPRCPINQARLFRERLLAAGYREGEDFEYVELGEQGHGTADMEQKVVWYSLLTDFLNRIL